MAKALVSLRLLAVLALTSATDRELQNQSCTLACINGGNCELLTIASHHQNTLSQLCVCPPGFGGLLCDIQTSVCFNAFGVNRYCQSGSPCVLSDGNAVCDCQQAYNQSAFGGLVCQYPATEYCTIDAGISSTAFCTNGGVCLYYVEESETVHPGCYCSEGFEGEHCEYLVGTMPQTNQQVSNDSMTFYILLICIFSLSLMVLGFLVCRWRRRKRSAGNKSGTGKPVTNFV